MAGILAEDILADCWKYVNLAEFSLAVEPVLSYNDSQNKMANQMRWKFNRALSYFWLN